MRAPIIGSPGLVRPVPRVAARPWSDMCSPFQSSSVLCMYIYIYIQIRVVRCLRIGNQAKCLVSFWLLLETPGYRASNKDTHRLICPDRVPPVTAFCFDVCACPKLPPVKYLENGLGFTLFVYEDLTNASSRCKFCLWYSCSTRLTPYRGGPAGSPRPTRFLEVWAVS